MSIYLTIGKTQDPRRFPKKITEQINRVRIITHSTPPVKYRRSSHWEGSSYRQGNKNQTERDVAFMTLGILKNVT